MRRRILIIAVLTLLALAVTLLLTNRAREERAVALHPQQEHPIGTLVFFRQNDGRWADDNLGESRYQMGGSGCLVSCIAASFHAQGIDTDPGKLNELFGENDVYNDEGEVLWGRIADAVPGVRFDVPGAVDVEKLENELAQGHYPIVKVKYLGTGYHHWVLIVGATDGEYLCMDPLSDNNKIIPLSRHGGMIFRVRYVWVEE